MIAAIVVIYVIGFLASFAVCGFMEFDSAQDIPFIIVCGLFWPVMILPFIGFCLLEYFSQYAKTRKLRIAAQEKVRIAQEQEIRHILNADLDLKVNSQ